MLYQHSEEDVFSNLSLSQLELEPLPKIIDTRGYIYLVFDKAFPDYIKLGRTSNLSKRLAMYNQDKPFNTTKYLVISKLFTDVITTESKILEAVYNNITPIGAKREWFNISNKQELLDIILLSESKYS